jgi:hypothetical protein
VTALHRAKANWKVDYRKIHPVRAFLPIGVRVSADMWENDDDDDHWIHTLQKIKRTRYNSSVRSTQCVRTEIKSMPTLTIYEPAPGRTLNALSK